jgi:agmatinase
MSSKESYDDSDIIILGVPMDITCSFKSGTRFGPQKIREVSEGIEEYSVYLEKSIDDSGFFDCGNINVDGGNVKENLSTVALSAKEVFDDGKFPIILGGEHLISVPVIREAYRKYGDDLIVIQFDAHADLRDGYLGCIYSHAAAIRRLCDFMPAKNIFQFGIRSGTKDEFEFADKYTNMFKFNVFEPLKNILTQLKGRPVYVTLDIDVVDPGYANGTGTPEPCGITSRELLDSVHLLKDLRLIGFDIVEVSPEYDKSDRTALLAALIIREIILIAEST